MNNISVYLINAGLFLRGHRLAAAPAATAARIPAGFRG